MSTPPTSQWHAGRTPAHYQTTVHHHPTAARLLLTELPARYLTTTEQPRSTAPTTTSGEGHPHICVDGENISRVF